MLSATKISQLLLLSVLWGTLLPSGAVDLNNDGLSDVWQLQYGAQNALPLVDDDGDTFDNLTECAAGTDPYSERDSPRNGPVGLTEDSVTIMMPTKAGKWYQLQLSGAPEAFSAFGPGVSGTGEMVQLAVTGLDDSTVKGGVSHSLWADISGNELSSLTGTTNFPASPSGQQSLSQFQIIPTINTGFGGSLRARVVAPETGSYQFSLSSAGAAELMISMTGFPSGFSKIADVLSSQTDLRPGVWNAYENQQSLPVNLIEGESYLLEVRYLASVPQAHCQLAWTPPSASEPILIPNSALAPAILLAAPQPESPVLIHDYDTAGQTGVLWPNNGTPVTGIPGMSGAAERFFPNSENVSLPLATAMDQHFYATWLVHMEANHKQVVMVFQNEATDPPQRGPRIDMESANNFTRALIRAGRGGDQTEIEVNFDQTYRIELVGTFDPEGFNYSTPQGERSVDRQRFDLYVTDSMGALIGSAQDLFFWDQNVDQFDSLQAFQLFNTPRAILDAWEITEGSISGSGYLQNNTAGFQSGDEGQFFRFQITDGDQDGDGISDWDEIQLSKHQPYLFFDANSVPGEDDMTRLSTALDPAVSLSEFSLQASDVAAFERNTPFPNADHAEVTITRTGSLAAVTINLCQEPLAATGNTATICDGTCCSLVGSAGEEAAEAEDYEIVDELGNIITNQVHFEFGEMSKKLTIRALFDQENEYPETLNLAIEEAEAGEYTIAPALNGASIQLFDLPEHPDNFIIFKGDFTPEPGATSEVTGFASAKLNGPRTKIFLTTGDINIPTDYVFLQQDSHVHKSNATVSGEVPGTIIFPIIDDAGEIINDPIEDHLWDLTLSSGAVPTNGGPASKQVIIDSLFLQNGESSLYLNLHSQQFPAGEVWAIFQQLDGSAASPGPPAPDTIPGSAEFPQLVGLELESEVRRFLNQATFGADDQEVNLLVSMIEQERLSNPDYHRVDAFAAWMDGQMAMQQTYLLDYHLATSGQYYLLRGAYDPGRNPSDDIHDTPTVPTAWPSVNRESANPEHWHITEQYPLTRRDLLLASRNNFGLRPPFRHRRRVSWQMMANARDQLRQKMGFALQQIVVVSAEAPFIRSQPFGADNYQDQLNHHAFNHYRDILGFVNWSPIMGKWLSSLQNQRAADLDGDGENDVFPDENLARENMQLFSIGLFQLWDDGTLVLDAEGLPVPTYDNDDIREFARILTGQSFRHWVSTSDPPRWGGVPFEDIPENNTFNRNQSGDGHFNTHYSYPMKMFGAFHDLGVKNFAGVTIDNTGLTNSTEQGIADIEAAVDWLAGKPGDGLPDYDMVHSHRSTPAFISRRLIQRFTTSNPSREYLHRVATVFRESEGDLGLTLRAILLDSAARVPDLNDNVFGMKKSPLESFTQVLRSLRGISYLPIVAPAVDEQPFVGQPGDFSNPQLYLDFYGYSAEQLANQERNLRFLVADSIVADSSGLQMNPMAQPSVFNWYLPDFTPGGAIAAAGLVAPELQLANEPDIIRNINFLEDFSRENRGVKSDPLVDDTARQRIAFGVTDTSVDDHDRIRLDRDGLALAFYPATEPAPTAERSSEFIADEILVDELDRRLTLGYLKQKYPYDSTDDEDPNGPPGNDLLKNPRELIIDAVHAHSNPYNGVNDEEDLRRKVGDAVYLITISPEFQIKK